MNIFITHACISESLTLRNDNTAGKTNLFLKEVYIYNVSLSCTFHFN